MEDVDMGLLYAVPAWLGLVVIVAAFVGVACGGHAIVLRYVSRDDVVQHNDVAGFIVAVVGVLYAVLLGFLTIVVWEHYAETQQRAQSEVDAATDVWRFDSSLAPADARRLRVDLAAYSAAVVDDEWPKMQRGESSAQTQRLIEKLFDDIATLPVKNAQQSNVQNRLLDRVQFMADLRRHRINDNESGVPTVLWLGLAIGGCIVIGFLYLFHVKNTRVQLLMTGATAAMIGVSFGLIVELDYPFRGEVSVSPAHWVALHASLEHEKPRNRKVVEAGR